MHLKIFLLLLFLACSAHSAPRHDCHDEIEKFHKCHDANPLKFTLLVNIDGFQESEKAYAALKECVGPVTCKAIQDRMEYCRERIALIGEQAKIYKCLKSDEYSSGKRNCQRQSTCSEPEYFDCLAEKLEESMECSEEDVDFFKGLTDDMVNACKAKEKNFHHREYKENH